MASYGLVLPEVFPKGTGIVDIKQITTSTDDNGENVIQAELFNGKKVEFKIRNGSKGNTGEAAGFTTPTAEIDDNTGKPSVEVTASGKDTAKKFHFLFKNLKGNKGDVSDIARSVVDFGDPTGKRTIQVGFAGMGLTAETTCHLAGFYNDGHGDRGYKIRDISATEVQKFLKLDSVDNTSDSQKSVKYAETAGSAQADGGNADTVGGYSAGNGVNMLVPVVAFNVGENAGYIKLGNGLIVQWGHVVGDEVDVTLPLAYSHYYSISLSTGCHSYSSGWSRTATYENKNLKGFHISVCLVAPIESDWLTIGF